MLWGGRERRMLAWVVKGKENFAGPDANAATVAHCARGGQGMRHTTKRVAALTKIPAAWALLISRTRMEVSAPANA